jgi:hypothetical protein
VILAVLVGELHDDLAARGHDQARPVELGVFGDDLGAEDRRVVGSTRPDGDFADHVIWVRVTDEAVLTGCGCGERIELRRLGELLVR